MKNKLNMNKWCFSQTTSHNIHAVFVLIHAQIVSEWLLKFICKEIQTKTPNRYKGDFVALIFLTNNKK